MWLNHKQATTFESLKINPMKTLRLILQKQQRNNVFFMRSIFFCTFRAHENLRKSVTKNMLIKDQLGTHVLLQKRTNRAEDKGCL